ncbi:MAG TPA: serine/threonine-protein kinase [Kofleriaceae bacterium]|nr:serine/threonine-protein kinase [Kofleriaceae bacterium]
MTFQDPFVGNVLDDRYEILQRVGEGGMGVVYRARQMSIDRTVAIKMLSAQMAKDPNWVQRFNQEARACSRLQHPNTIRMFDFGQTKEGRLYMAMEFLDGQSLRDAIARGAPMAAVRVAKILIQCCASLAEAHSFGIIHRDIKPDNVFLLNMAGSPDFVKLLDFSVAKLLQENDAMRTQAGVVFGTPQYMSPEQGRGMPLDARSDIYALGILAYEMLMGRVPFTDDNPMNVLQMHIRQPVPVLPAVIPQGMRDIVERCLQKDPGRRYQSATEMMQHCQQVFASLGMAGNYGGAAAPQQHPPPDSEATMMAVGQSPFGSPPPPGGGPPPAAGPSQVYGGSAPAAYGRAPSAAPAAQKTMIADMGGPGPAPPPGQPAAQKTMIAEDASALLPPGFRPPSLPPGSAPGAGALSSGAPQKTMMLDPSEGVVSFAAKGGSAPVATPSHGLTPAAIAHEHTDQTSLADLRGATPLFWIICLLTGLGVGVLAYIAVLELG